MIYLDNASTTWPKIEVVQKFTADFFDKCVGSNGRTYGMEDVLEPIRKKILQYFDAEEAIVVFLPSATIAMNIVIESFNNDGSEIITTNCEHHCVYRRLYEKKMRFKIVDYFDMKNGEKPEEIIKNISDKTKLVIMNHGSNVTGDVYNVMEVGSALKRKGICFAVDISQTAGSQDISFSEMNCDILVGTTHKHLYGITGTGFLIFKKNIELKPLFYGGTGKSSFDMYQPKIIPDIFEVGTSNLLSIMSFEKSIDFLNRNKRAELREYESKLIRHFIECCKNMEMINLIETPIEKKTGVISFNVKGLDPSLVVAPYLWEKAKILVRSGLHCAPCIHKAIGSFPLGTVRMSVSAFNTIDEVNCLVETLNSLCKEIG